MTRMAIKKCNYTKKMAVIMKSYPFYPRRMCEALDGAWDFKWLGDVDFDTLEPSGLAYDGLMAVPGVFDTCPEHFGARGVGVYRRKLFFAAKSEDTLRLRLGGLGLYARIWWDGREIGECGLPYSYVDYDFLAGDGPMHELAIAVDNRFDKEHCPLFSPNFDFYAYGGIYRSVELQRLPVMRVERVQVTTLEVDTGRIGLLLRLGGEVPKKLTFSVRFDNGTADDFSCPVEKNEVALDIAVPDFKVWSPESPNLHVVEVAVDGDCVVERFGIRKVETRGHEILLNDRPIRLKGVNRHESHPELGPVQNTHLMLDDLRMLKDLGCNFVRCVHYPQNQEFLDLCDKMGMLVWQESLGWGNLEPDALDRKFIGAQVSQTELMARRSVNHPSVILWGFLNECCSDTQGGRQLYQALKNAIKSVDSSFLVTYASSRPEGDICFDLADVAAINIYPGWFSDVKDWTTPSSGWIKDGVSRVTVRSHRPDLADKPLIISEIGVGALYGCHDRASAQWSEEYQADYMAEACRRILGNPRYAGLALWQFFDTRSFVNAGSDVRGKPRGFNCAGLLDEYRRPKLAYAAVKAVYRGVG